ncbi:MAG: SH3 domain-containing protein [Limisphaerales bacterium]
MKKALPALLLAACAAAAQDSTHRPARALRDAVNIRARATLEGEVIGQLRRGDEVRARGEVAVTNAPPGEPALWYIIELPDSVKLWVHGGFLDPATGSLKVRRLNVRAGPGEEFSVVGRIEQGTEVREVARQEEWIQIAPPPGILGFVAGPYLEVEVPTEKQPPAATAPPETSAPASAAALPAGTATPAAPQVTPAPPPQESVSSAPAPAAATHVPDATHAAAPGILMAGTPSVPVAEPAPMSSGSSLKALLDAAGEPRVVRREGRLARSWNIQAPGSYAIRDLQTGRVMNYLHGERFADRRWSDAVGRTVVITGREFLDARWPSLPVLEAEHVEIVR